ncbi:MAG: metalloregulator ArsR/SmtB family transcription factor [Devosiaceae bacterium]|nr:metalloregulator ArsR/SmtB family transcription factor [Devosiaceae bacterium]
MDSLSDISLTPPQKDEHPITGATASTTASTTAQSAQMLENANKTTDFLKSLAHPARLMILCRLAEGHATVGQLEEMLDLNQSSVSKQLSRLRAENFVKTERKGRSIYYSLADDRVRLIVGTLYTMFCETPDPT